jgi:RNA polymerase sigma factor (sigma-70 family)
MSVAAADEAQMPGHMAVQREQDDRLWELLKQLPRLSQQVIHLRFVYDLSCAEIAEALGKREGAVRKQLWRAQSDPRALSQCMREGPL